MASTEQSRAEEPHAPDYQELIDTLDRRTKVAQLTGATTFTLAPQQSIGLAEVRLSDGPTGVRGLKFVSARPVALFPNATLLASAWSEDTAYEVGTLLAEEALAQGIHVVLGPTINLHRSPLGGRLFEAFSEDPLLTGRLAAAYVLGMQSRGVAACLKHLVANESETDRNTMNSVVDEATLRQVYLLPFEIAVRRSDPWAIMAAYNDVNGVAATEHAHINTEIVKGEWNYSGLIMSDWFATKSTTPAANGGLDLVMPGPDGPWGDALLAAVENGDVSESTVDDHLRRQLRLADRVGALGEPRSAPTDLPAPDSPRRREQLTRLAAAGITVLTNDENLLPLNRKQTVALIGRHALETIDMGGGSAQVTPPYQVSVAEGLTALLGDLVSVTDGVEVRSRPVPTRGAFLVDPETGQAGVRFTLMDSAGRVIEDRHSPTATTIVNFDDDFGTPVASVLIRAQADFIGLIDFGGIGVGRWDVTVGAQSFQADLTASGHGFGEEILNPPISTTALSINGPTAINGTVHLPLVPPMGHVGAADRADLQPSVAVIGVVARQAARDAATMLAEATEAARHADVAVVVVGLTDEQETEAVDKTTLRLPGDQDALVIAVAQAATKTVVVVNAATPVLMPWAARVDAILFAGLPGQEGGHAIAAALLGDIEPAGRLVTTFPAQDGDSPSWSVSPVDGQLHYREGAFIGYRGHYAHAAPAPAFWLGHGLGFSTWDYSGPRLDAGADRSVTVTVTVTNTGTRESREVPQLYFQPGESDEPIRLVGWASVTLGAGRSTRVTVTADPCLLRRWDAESAGWETLSGAGTYYIARGLGDIRAAVATTAG